MYASQGRRAIYTHAHFQISLNSRVGRVYSCYSWTLIDCGYTYTSHKYNSLASLAYNNNRGALKNKYTHSMWLISEVHPLKWKSSLHSRCPAEHCCLIRNLRHVHHSQTKELKASITIVVSVYYMHACYSRLLHF